MPLLQNVSDQLAGPKHSPRQKRGSAGITQDIPTCLQVCWEPESSQLNSPTYQGTAASGKGKLLQPESQNSPSGGSSVGELTGTPGR